MTQKQVFAIFWGGGGGIEKLNKVHQKTYRKHYGLKQYPGRVKFQENTNRLIDAELSPKLHQLSENILVDTKFSSES